MKSLRTSFIVVCCLLAAPAVVLATSFVLSSDAELVDAADAIVIATAASSHAQPNPLIGIVTVTDFAIERVLKGSELGSSIRLTELGGQIENRFVMVHASPRFSEGERVLLFLERTPREEWRVLNMVLGKFNFVRDREGRGLLVRSLEDAPVWTKSGESHHERARSEDGFLKFISARVRGEAPAEDYFVDSSVLVSASESRTIAPMTHRTPFLLSISGVGAFRWQNPTATFARCDAAACALPSGLDGVGAITNGMGLWNAVGAGINYSLGGTTTNTAPTSTGSGSDDGVNNIVYNDPHGLVTGTFGSGSNVLGIGIVYGDFTYTLSGDSEVFINIPEGDVVMNNGISSANLSQAVLNVAMAHELGHTLGFQHSNDAPAPHTTTLAVMNSSVNTGCGGLCTYDVNAATTVYGSGGPPPCTPPSITTHPQSTTITSGTSANLSASASGTSPLTFQWFRGASGNTSSGVQGTGTSFNTGVLTTTTQFWVRVTGQCNPVADSNTATVTVTTPTCTQPVINVHPQSTTITSGNSANLSVTASGGPPLTYQWFRGAAPDTSQLVGTDSPNFNTGPLTAQAQFWVRVSAACGTPVNSATAVVNVEAACTPPSIFSQPQNQTIQSGGTAILSVGASGTGLTFQWFRGNSPDTSNPVSGATFATVSIGPLTQNTNFWVRVTGLCGTPVNSATVTVTVTTVCTAISITSQPTSRQIAAGTSTTLTVGVSGTSPTFQWFQGTPPGGTPIGSNSPSLTVAPGVTTSYWVRVSNACSGPFNSAAAIVTVCPAGHLCLLNGRFQLALFASDPRSGRTAVGAPVPENEVFGFFSLAELTGSADIPEVFVKILDASTLPTNPSFWVFFSGLTDLQYTVVITDTVRGIQRQFSKPGFSLCGNVDADAFRLSDLDPVIEVSVEDTSTDTEIQPHACVPNTLCLLNGRFEVSLTARNPSNGQTATGGPIQKNDLFGYFNIVALTGNTQNPEVFVKMIDGTSVFGKFLFFHGSLTHLEYTVTVRDTLKSFRAPVSYSKAAGIPFCGGAEAPFDP